MSMTLVALALSAALVGTAAAESTHEANQAATAITAAPSTLTAEAVLAQITDADGTLRFDVAEDGTRFLWADSPLFADRRAASGAPFLAQGYIYPEGTLSARDDGVNADGSPQFPERVLGEWSSYGWSVGNATLAPRGPGGLATQLFQFGSEWGAVTLVSEGYVSAGAGGAVDRAITGGTGPLATMRGEVRDTTLGINETAGGNARYEVRLWAP
jgi:hypothetical protein